MRENNLSYIVGKEISTQLKIVVMLKLMKKKDWNRSFMENRSADFTLTGASSLN